MLADRLNLSPEDGLDFISKMKVNSLGVTFLCKVNGQTDKEKSKSQTTAYTLS